MKKIQVYLLAGALFSITLSACKKSEPTTVDPVVTEAKITVDNPQTSADYAPGALVTINGKIENTAEMHGYKIVLLQKSDSTELFSKEVHEHNTEIDFNESWTNNLPADADVQLQVIAVLDHDGHTSIKTVDFHCQGE